MNFDNVQNFVNTFSGNPFNRCNNERHDPAFLESLLQKESSVVVLFHQLKPLLSITTNDAKIVWKSLQKVLGMFQGKSENPSQTQCLTLLGTLDSVGYWAIDVTSLEASSLTENTEEKFTEVRNIAPRLSLQGK
jgi:hypothetical protein